jgi:hypothetical protein
MSELRRPLATFGDDELGTELRALAAWLDGPPIPVPGVTPDAARRARQRIEAGSGGAPRRAWWPFGGIVGRAPALRRSFVLAVVALVVLAAIAGAIGFGVPGIRIIFTGATPSPQTTAPPASSQFPTSSPSPTVAPTPGPLGSVLDLGFQTTPAEAPALGGFALALPASSSVGPPDTTWFTEGRVTLVWKAKPGLPETLAPGVGLLLTEFRGSINEEFFQKMIGPGTTVSPVMIGDVAGWWISGDPHEIMYLDERGDIVADSRRFVGNTLLWSRGDLTFRMETSLERGAAIGLAATIR